MKRLAVAGVVTVALVMPATPVLLPTVAHAATIGSCAPRNFEAYRAHGSWQRQGVTLSGRSTTRGRDVTTTVAVIGVGTYRRVNGPEWHPTRRKLYRAPLALVTIRTTGSPFVEKCSFRLRRAS